MKKVAAYSFYAQLTVFFIGVVLVSSCTGQTNELQENTNITSFIPSCATSCGYLDRDGMLWFGTNNGVFRYDGSLFTAFFEKDGLCNEKVSAISQDKEGNMWFGTTKGLCSYDGTSFTQIPIPWSDTSGVWLDEVYPIVNPNEVRSIVEDDEGNLWIGTNGAGAYKYDGSTFANFLAQKGEKQKDGLHHNVIESLFKDDAGNIWFTSMTHGGVTRYDGNSFVDIMPKDGLSDDMVRSCFQDKSENIWFGTNGNRNGGLDKYNPKTKQFTNFNESDGLCLYKTIDRCYNGVQCIYEDKKGKLWIGSGLGQLHIYDGKTFTPFVTQDGHSVSNVMYIIEDLRGNLWFGTNSGHLYRYDGKNLTDMMQSGC